MIEEIKKEIEPLIVLDDVLYCKDCGSRNIKKSYKPYKIAESIMKILDKYKKQEDNLRKIMSKMAISYKEIKNEDIEKMPTYMELLKYKNAWNELKEGIEINMDYYDSSKFKEFVSLNDIEELEQKYGIGE